MAANLLRLIHPCFPASTSRLPPCPLVPAALALIILRELNKCSCLLELWALSVWLLSPTFAYKIFLVN